MAKSPCVHAEHEIFSAYETHADADRWTTPGRRAAIDGLMRLAAGTWEKYDAPVPKKLVDFTRHKRDIMNKHNRTRAPIAMGMKWMAGYATGVAAGLPVRHLTYEELNDDHSKLDDIREWILGEQASDPRCAPDHRNTTLKVHVGPVSSHVANWEAVEETLRGTRYEHFLSE